MVNSIASGLVSSIQIAGSPVLIIPAANHGGGVIVNPLSNVDQEIDVAEPLYVSLIRTTSPAVSGDATSLMPGQSFLAPPGAPVWISAATAGHAFTSYFLVPPQPPPPAVSVPGAPGFGIPGPIFPPSGPTGLTSAIPAYLYKQYEDDDDLQTFIEALNSEQQDYVDTFNALNLPYYPGPLVSGLLLDWVGKGVYGYPRPVLASGMNNLVGLVNTWGPNDWGVFPQPDAKGNFPAQTGTVPQTAVASYVALVGGPLPNGLVLVGPSEIAYASDDTYRRCLTWHYQKGDRRYFNIRWLKRRIMRFCYGVNGTSPNIDETNQISITFGPNFEVCIRFVLGLRTVTGGAMLNRWGPNGFGIPFDGGASPQVDIQPNDIEGTYVAYPSLPYMSIFKEAVESGVLELPFQFRFFVAIDGVANDW
jgi:hypothetical protein